MHSSYYNPIYSYSWSYQNVILKNCSLLNFKSTWSNNSNIKQSHLVFLHICTHASYKAILWIFLGSIIHSLNEEQDTWKIGGPFNALSVTTSVLIIGSLALTGMPFLAGFYSKDLIIEAANMSYINAWALLMTLLGTSVTAAYSTRIVFVLFGQPQFITLNNINENNPTLIN